MFIEFSCNKTIGNKCSTYWYIRIGYIMYVSLTYESLLVKKRTKTRTNCYYTQLKNLTAFYVSHEINSFFSYCARMICVLFALHLSLGYYIFVAKYKTYIPTLHSYVLSLSILCNLVEEIRFYSTKSKPKNAIITDVYKVFIQYKK